MQVNCLVLIVGSGRGACHEGMELCDVALPFAPARFGFEMAYFSPDGRLG